MRNFSFPSEDDESVLMKAWNIGSQDKLTPDSIYSKSFEKQTGADLPDFWKQCAARCRDTPGCFKFKIEEDHSCQLRGNIMEERTDDSYGQKYFQKNQKEIKFVYSNQWSRLL